MNREGLLCPINYQSHWWVLSVTPALSSYSILDSLGLRFEDEVLAIIALLQSNDFRGTCSYEGKSLCFPQQRSNGAESGVFSMCGMVCEANQIPHDFSFYNMDHVREHLAYYIVNDLINEVSCPSLWQGIKFFHPFPISASL